MGSIIEMWIILLASCVITAGAATTGDIICVNNIRHKTEILFEESVYVILTFSFVINYKLNVLYFLENGQLVTLDLDSGEDTMVEEYAMGLAVDQETSDLYIGTDGRGFFKKSGTYSKHYAGTDDIFVRRPMFYKKQLYYTEFNPPKLWSWVDGQAKKLTDYEVFQILIDDEDTMFFRNRTGMFSKQINSNDSTLIYNKCHVDYIVMDSKTKIYFACLNVVYEYVKANATVRKVATLNVDEYYKKIVNLVFDKYNNIIYSDFQKVYRLSPMIDNNRTTSCT